MSASSPSRTRRWLVLAGVLVVAGVAGALVWFFSGDEPDEVDAERALQQDQDDSLTDLFAPDVDLGGEGDGTDPGDVDDPDDQQDPEGPGEEPDGSEDDPSGGSDEQPPPDGDPDLPPEGAEDLDGVWIVDHTREFDRAAGRGTFVGYRIEEELENIGSSTAVGRSPEVEGEVVFDGRTVTDVTIEADLTALESDDGRRDSRVRRHLGPDARATFELAEPIELPEVPPVGEVIELTTTGTLTILEESEEVEVDLQAVVAETGLLITGSTRIRLPDFGVEAPSAPIVLSVSDEAVLEWQLFLVPG